MAKRVEVSPFDRAYEGILEYIDAHGLSEGDRLPSERELCVTLDVSRTTLRSALAELSAHHIVDCKPGAGSFVCPPLPTIHLDDLSGFSEIVHKIGKTPVSHVVWKGVIACPDDIAPRLALAAGDPVFQLRRVRCVEDEAVCLETSFVSVRACPGIEAIDFSKESLTATLESRYGMPTVHTSLTVSVGRASKDEAALLSIPARDLIFFERGMHTDDDLSPVEYYESLYVPERFGIVCNTVFKQPALASAGSEGGAAHGQGL